MMRQVDRGPRGCRGSRVSEQMRSNIVKMDVKKPANTLRRAFHHIQFVAHVIPDILGSR